MPAKTAPPTSSSSPLKRACADAKTLFEHKAKKRTSDFQDKLKMQIEQFDPEESLENALVDAESALREVKTFAKQIAKDEKQIAVDVAAELKEKARKQTDDALAKLGKLKPAEASSGQTDDLLASGDLSD